MIHQSTLIKSYKEKEAECKLAMEDSKHYKKKCMMLLGELEASKLKNRRLAE